MNSVMYVLDIFIYFHILKSKLKKKSSKVQTSWFGIAVSQLVAEEVAVVGPQVHFHRKMIAHLQSLKHTNKQM